MFSLFSYLRKLNPPSGRWKYIKFQIEVSRNKQNYLQQIWILNARTGWKKRANLEGTFCIAVVKSTSIFPSIK